MELPLDILDYIFNLLNTHPESLLAISNAHPVFSQLVERHRYRHIRFHASLAGFHSSSLVKILADNPRIASHVRVLEIKLIYTNPKEISSILPMFPALECLLLPIQYPGVPWQSLPDTFTTAVEDYLNHSPSIQVVHIGYKGFPLSLLDNHMNITYLSLSRSPEISDRPDILYPQLKALSVKGFDIGQPFVDWAKRHIAQLQSLKYESPDCYLDKTILGLLEICSDTLINLDLGLGYDPLLHALNKVDVDLELSNLRIDLSSLPLLQNITLRVYESRFWDYYYSSLPAAVKILQTASSLQHLTLEVHLVRKIVSIDFSPLEAWAKSSTTFNQIDLYISGISITLTEFLSSVERYGCLMGLIEECVVVIHIGNAPHYFDMQSHYA